MIHSPRACRSWRAKSRLILFASVTEICSLRVEKFFRMQQTITSPITETTPPPAPEVVQVLVTTDPDGKWSAHSLELLSDACAVAKRLNGRVGAWVLTGPDSKLDFNGLGEHGCHHVRHLKNSRFSNWSSEAVAATLSAHRSPDCRLIFLPGTARGEEVAALLAEKLETLWIPDALTLSVTRSGSLEITAVVSGGKLSRIFRTTEKRPTIATMRAGVSEARREKVAAMEVREMEVDLSGVPNLTTVEKFFPADPKTVDITYANRIVSAGRGTSGPTGIELVSKLAESLRASLGASRMVVDLGWAPPERQVGQTGRTVRPDLYVACGISGASHHLAGMRDSQHIVAINPDAEAPIHEVAHLSLHGNLHQVIPEIIMTLEKRSKGTQI